MNNAVYCTIFFFYNGRRIGGLNVKEFMFLKIGSN